MRKEWIATVAVVMFTCSMAAQKPAVVTSKASGWQRIGQTTAALKMEKESIVPIGADVFKAIKLRVLEAALQIESLQVSYENGEMEDIPVKSLLKEGEETREMEVKQLGLKRVHFTYKTILTGNRKAVVELWGLK